MTSSCIIVNTSPPATRTPKHELTILRKSIDILRDDASHAEALRLKVTRVKEQKKFEWEKGLTELDTLKENISEQKLIAEFLTEDIDEIRIRIQKKERKSRLSCTSEERIANMEESLKDKKLMLLKSIVLETVRKKELEEYITNYEVRQKVSRHSSLERVSEYDDSCVISISTTSEDEGGAGDILDTPDDLLHMRDQLQKISRSYEEICNQRETLDQEVHFLETKLKEIRIQVENNQTEVKVMKTELYLKERQLFDTETQKEKTLRLVQTKEKICEEALNAFRDAEKSYVMGNNSIRIIKQLIKDKIEERRTLEKFIQRENEILEFKRFSQNVDESIPIPIDEHYCGMDPNVVKYLNKVIKGCTQDIPSSFWTDDLGKLSIDFEDKIEALKKNAPTETKTTTESSFKTFLDERGQSHQKCHRKHQELGSEEYNPPSLPVKNLINYRQSKSDTLAKPIGFKNTKFNKKNPISTTNPTSKITFPSIYSHSVGGLRKLFLKVNNSLAPGVDNYPKTVVVNGVMYRLQDRIGEPEILHGPLTFCVWKRHEADNQQPLKFPQRKISHRLYKLFLRSLFNDT